MIMNFDILYKNGHSEVIVQEAEEEVLTQILSLIDNSFFHDTSGIVRFSDGKETYVVRINDVCRVKYEVIESGDGEDVQFE